MKNLSFTLCTAYTALLAFFIVCIDILIRDCLPLGEGRGFIYISFIAWSVYFFAGCTLKGGIKAAIGYAVGLAFAIAIFELAGLLSCAGCLAVPIAVFIMVFLVLFLQKVPWLDMIPAVFISAGCFFGVMGYVPEVCYCTAVSVILLYALLGLTFGWLTITGQALINKMVNKK